MHELVVTDIDADVREGLAHGVEEHQIARAQIIGSHGRADLADFNGTARQHEAEGVIEHVADKAAAVQAGFGAVAAEAVTHADQAKRIHDQVASLAGNVAGGIHDRRQQATLAFRMRVRAQLGRSVDAGIGILEDRIRQHSIRHSRTAGNGNPDATRARE
ncbi:hypothetical protein AWV79_30130 [Cupriavidus sp. UYMMa02A]|nr:hypothetical protein AWV79_30130 [Cupriavidus sp. UYMMa02A]